MNNENNNLNNGQTVVPNTNPVPINNVNQPINSVSTTPVVPEVLTPATAPVVQQAMPVVEPTTTPMVQQAVPNTEVPTVPNVDNNAMINENLQKVEIKDYTPPSKFKIFVLLVFFALIVAFIMFLPQISEYIRNYNNPNKEVPVKEEVITTGKLVCSMTSNTSELDKEYEFSFNFTDSKLKRTKYTAYTRGDSTTEALLDEANEKCKTLKELTSELEGFNIRCDYSSGKLTETQVFELDTIDTEKLAAAFTEAGGILPSYKNDQDIDSIETNMKASGYTCSREK